MLIPNRVNLDDLATAAIGDIAGLPAEQLALLQQEVADLLTSAKRLKDRLDRGLDLKYRDRATALRRSAGKDAGTVRIEDGDVVVVAELPKRVDWDQRGLAAVVERIRAAGDDPAEYIDVTYKVPERKYNAWPERIRASFATARTVETGKAIFTLTLKPEA
ncbi:MAG: hypothetical protein AB7V13_21830 [Pseudorhodoplanes sp.]